jgi:Fic family protein
MPFDPAVPYNDLPPLPPAKDVETKAVLKASGDAKAALSALKTAGGLIPNQSVLINSIPILEAQASSAIENIVTTTDKLFRHAGNIDDTADGPTREAFRYRTALKEGFDHIKERPLGTTTCVKICQVIKGSNIDIRKTTGTTLRNHLTAEVIYTPPEGEALIRDKLANWEKFLHESTDIEPLVRMAVMHYQFEAIHPFIDGNGRTGRVLNLLFLIEQGLLDLPVLYLSLFIMKNKTAYYNLLRGVTANGEWEPWILYMLEAVKETATWTTEKIKAIKLLLDNTAKLFREADPRIYSRELTELIFAQPYCRISTLVDANIAGRHAASNYLNRMVELGILEQVEAKGAQKVFVNPRFLALLKAGDGADLVQTATI